MRVMRNGLWGGVAAVVFGAAGCATTPWGTRGLTAGQEARGSWWMQETALTTDGKLSLSGKPWWPQALELRPGEQFTVDPGGRMIVRRESLTRREGPSDAIVWVIDDDADGSVAQGGDTDSDCYVVDYGRNGLVDRMVDYIDDDGDQDPDEMDIRYFVDGALRQVWCGLDLDDDNAMWDLVAYEYSADFFKSDPHGDAMIFMNKFDPQRGEWVPISECPFAFYDTDSDTYSEVVVRASAAPLARDVAGDPDYANDARRYRGEWGDEMRRMGLVNIRYSFDADNLSGPETPLHYDFGFNLVGSVPYRFSGMEHFNPKRRPPQVVRVIPHDRVRAVADRYPAVETGFTWHEYQDDTIAIGAPPHEGLDRRWEGVFWIWERRFMENTGGPCQKWNMRREWSRRPTDRRELYYSGVDRRIHLFGAEEGWIQVGHCEGTVALGEIRMFDTDGNGYFDRWEVYKGQSPVPVRVSRVRDEKAKRIPFDYERIVRFYTQEMLPGALAANDKLAAAMTAVRPFAAPPGLAAALQTGSPGERRFVQDVVREMQYQALRQYFMAEANRVIAEAKMNDLRQVEHGAGRDSAWAWEMIRLIEKLDVAYGQGDFDQACGVLAEIGRTAGGAEK